jgi:hypothetical protein
VEPQYRKNKNPEPTEQQAVWAPEEVPAFQKTEKSLRDFTLALELGSGLLRGVRWYDIDVSALPINPILKGSPLSLENVINR